ncbi:hypothetical protein PILCRDRAFT_488655 [Piloderma croceum F 1598]|uniref:Uncharacterized protein n=1 Tax=Piloderma croceum (strain F 1598) TaxID=765440 RepID=A0A0C3FAS0_PILCF|nr:hypothetical protein PILCRDRAFT_488655 [Piloderma croceum F 1598]
MAIRLPIMSIRSSECDASSTCGSSHFHWQTGGWFLLALGALLIIISICLNQTANRTTLQNAQIQPGGGNHNCAPNYASSFTPSHPAAPQTYLPPPPSPSLLRDSYSKNYEGPSCDATNTPQISNYNNI